MIKHRLKNISLQGEYSLFFDLYLFICTVLKTEYFDDLHSYILSKIMLHKEDQGLGSGLLSSSGMHLKLEGSGCGAR